MVWVAYIEFVVMYGEPLVDKWQVNLSDILGHLEHAINPFSPPEEEIGNWR
jgi:hypothetical protein